MSSPIPPASFEPLASSNQTPGDADSVSRLSRRYLDTADEINKDATRLKSIADGAPDTWKGLAGSAFQSKASDLAGKITKAHERYEAAGSALKWWAQQMPVHQAAAYKAVNDAQGAQQTMSANAPGPAPKAGDPPPTDAEKAAAKTAAHNYSGASGDLKSAHGAFQRAVSDYNNDAQTAANEINHAADHDGLKDSWWDRNFGWLATAFHIIGIVIVVLAVVVLILAFPECVPALLVTVLEYTTAGLMLAQTIFDGIAWATGKQGATAFVFDLVGDATFGAGKILGSIAKVSAESGGKVAGAVAAGRAGRSTISELGHCKILFSLANHGGEDLVRALPGMSGDLDKALGAAKVANSTVQDAFKGATADKLIIALTKDHDIAQTIAGIQKADTVIGGSIRTSVAASVSKITGVTGGITDSAGGVTSGTYNIQSWISDHVNDAQLDHTLDRVSQFWGNPVIGPK